MMSSPNSDASTPIIQRLDPDPRDPDRVVVTVGPADGSPGAARTLLLHIAVVAEEGLHAGQPCPPDRAARLEAANLFQQYYARALNFLAVRPRSESEVRRRLREKAVPPAVIDGICARLQRAGYLDDAAFARFWIAERARSNPRGARLLRAELRQKGVAGPVIEQALADFEEEAEAQDTTLAPAPGVNNGASAAYPAPNATDEAAESREGREARALAEKKLRAYAGLDAPTRRQRLGAFLLRRGYAWPTIARALKAVLADEDSEDESTEIE